MNKNYIKITKLFSKLGYMDTDTIKIMPPTMNVRPPKCVSVLKNHRIPKILQNLILGST
jgi:hypothetical protein